jgi:RNA polymerase sigma-70 factor, ECF subfamily
MYHELPTLEVETYQPESFEDCYRAETREPIVHLEFGRRRTSAEALPEESPWEAWVNRQDEVAARELVKQLTSVVLRSVRRRRPMQADEEDLAQVIFTKVFSKLPQYSGLVPLEHWVSRIAVNTCLNQLKHELSRPESRLNEFDERALLNQPAPDSDEAMGSLQEEKFQLLEKMLSGLKPDERKVIQMLHLEEKTTEEISRQTGWSESLVKVKAFRARNKMRKRWAGKPY